MPGGCPRTRPFTSICRGRDGLRRGQTMEPFRPSTGLLVILCASLLLNALLLAHHYLPTSPSTSRLGEAGNDAGGLSWALPAAREAEAVAAADCSGHGRVFLDGIAGEDGRPGCECNSCFSGPDCSVRKPDCAADADSGDPMFLEPYWMRHAAASAVLLSGWHRLSYITTNGLFQSVELERCIGRLHRAVGNAVADGKHMVFATGSVQLINALVHALSPDAADAASPASVVATAPYYPVYRKQTVMFDGREYKWGGTTTTWANATSDNSTSTKDVVEFITSPNNPDALLRKQVLGGALAVVDRAYYWPHFTHIPTPADDDVMLFTVTKLSGHASSRFGWALIRDGRVAEKADRYIQMATMGVSRDTQLRVLKVMKVMLANLHGKDDIFSFGHDVMRSRWRRLNAVVSRSRRISLQKIPPQFCTYFNKIREPSPAYAWVKCEREEDRNCTDALLKENIITRAGGKYSAGSRYTRASLLKAEDDFEVLLERVTELVDAERVDDAAGSGTSSSM